MTNNSPQKILSMLYVFVGSTTYRFVEQRMDVTFLYIKKYQVSDKFAECILDLRNVLRNLKVLEALARNRKISYGLIDFSSDALDVLEVHKCLRGS